MKTNDFNKILTSKIDSLERHQNLGEKTFLSSVDDYVKKQTIFHNSKAQDLTIRIDKLQNEIT